jgi:hypothetical protein
VHRGARTAASVALVLGGVGLAAAAPDPHWLAQQDDLDCDQLSFAEELLRGTSWERPDTDGDGVLDGPQTALALLDLIQHPPEGVTVEHHPLRGVEICTACGAPVNMGGFVLRHLARGLAVQLPYVALHYLERGGLAYDGDLHAGRIELSALEAILEPMDPAHVLPAESEDGDLDGLLDDEDPVLGTDPSAADSDADTLRDGPQLAEELVPIIGGLARSPVSDQPYLIELQMDGIERCEVCGIDVNMGHVDIVNPLEDLTVSVSFVALHTLGHGGFVYEGSVQAGRILPTVLRTVLQARGHAHWLSVPGDADGDGLTDAEELRLGLDPSNPDENADGEPDGRSLATELEARVGALPDQPRHSGPYVEHFLTLGVYPCLTCAESVNMGFVRIIDPIESRSLDVPYYSLHFLRHGSFSTDRPSLYGRVDPSDLAQIVGLQVVGTQPVSGAFSFWNAPNPFRSGGSTTIVLAVPQPERVRIDVFDLRGRRVRRLFEGELSERIIRLRWDGRDDGGRVAASGIYLCKAVFGDLSVSRKVVLAP